MEKRILSQLEKWQDELLDFTGRLVATPSCNPPGDERAVAQLIVKQLHELDLVDVRLVNKSATRPNVLCAISRGLPGPTLILNAHTDTKPVGEAANQWYTDPLTPTLRDGKLFGLGSTDMKAAVAAIVYAGAVLKKLDVPLAGRLLLVLSADEENGSAYGAKHLVQNCGLTADAAVVCEPTGLHEPWELIALVSRGICGFKIQVRGTQMHSSISDVFPSVNASLKMANVLTQMAEHLTIRAPEHPLCPGGITLNLGVKVQGGVHYGVYPGYAEFWNDLRTIPGMTLETVQQDIEVFLNRMKASDPTLEVAFEFEAPPLQWIPAVELSSEAPIVTVAREAADVVLGKAPTLGAYPAMTDGTYLSMAGIPTIPAFGPGFLPLAHGANEYVPVDDVLKAAQIYALIAFNYLSSTS